MVRQIQRKVSITGSGERALGAARDIFVNNDFRIVAISSSGFEVRGPRMNSSHQNPLVGISRAQFEVTGRELSATAELGGLKSMSIMMVVLVGTLALMCVGMAMFMGPPPHDLSPSRFLLALGPGAPWPVLLPLMIRWMRRRAERALDTLMANAAAIAGSPEASHGR